MINDRIDDEGYMFADKKVHDLMRDLIGMLARHLLSNNASNS